MFFSITTWTPSGTSSLTSSQQRMPARRLAPAETLPFVSTDDEQEDEDPLEDGPGFQIFRMNTMTQQTLPLVSTDDEQEDEDSLEQENCERQVVPDGLERECTGKLEHQIHPNPPPKRVRILVNR